MQAIILAAGMGKRLKSFTAKNTKCMVKVHGKTLIERTLCQLDQCNLSRIVIVIGYQGKKLVDYIQTLNIKTPIIYVENTIYDKTNNIYSLFLAREYLKEEDTLLFESDIIFEPEVLKMLLEDPRPTLALVDRHESWMDGTCLKIDANDRIIDFISGKALDYESLDSYYKTVNIYKFSKRFSKEQYLPFLDAYTKALGSNEYYEQVLRVIAMLDYSELRVKRLGGQIWYEIDDLQDLDIAHVLFAPTPEQKLNLLEKRYGGFWRFPKLLDFCYLVNPYFPPKRMICEMKSQFETLLTQYPSGLGVNTLLVAKKFGLPEEMITVGNGAAELIRSLMNHFTGKIGVIRPTFEEYPNRYTKKDLITYEVPQPDFRYSVSDLTKYFGEKELSALILINPDNPSGNYIPKQDLQTLFAWAASQKITLVIDESFVDFSDEKDASLLLEEILKTYPNLFVVKSISKSYGVPGIRLGILASADTDTIKSIKSDLSIWNINSFAEFYLQIQEKYTNEYTEALEKFRTERLRFFHKLKKLPGLRPIPSQANYIMAELTGQKTAQTLTQDLLFHHHILIKSLYQKTGREWIRIAVRNETDNNRLIDALEKELEP